MNTSMVQYAYPDRLGASVSLIGGGGIGSNLLPLLAKLGVPRLKLWDDDIVNPVNLEMQHFAPEDIGREKSYVLRELARSINPAIRVDARNHRFSAEKHWRELDGIVIAAVDSMVGGRYEIFEGIKRANQAEPGKVKLLIDGRLDRKLHFFIDLYAIDPADPWSMDAYKESLFDETNRPRDPRPTSIVAHIPYVLSGLVGELLARWVQDRGRLPWKVTFDASTLHLEPYFVPAQQKEEVA